MALLADSIRGTVQGVLRAAGHVAWYLSWHTGETGAVRECAGEREAA
jgi:hypothetical protein